MFMGQFFSWVKSNEKELLVILENLAKLVNDEIVSYKKVDLKKNYFVVEKKRIANLITEYHPDVVENASDNLADIMSSL